MSLDPGAVHSPSIRDFQRRCTNGLGQLSCRRMDLRGRRTFTTRCSGEVLWIVIRAGEFLISDKKKTKLLASWARLCGWRYKINVKSLISRRHRPETISHLNQYDIIAHHRRRGKFASQSRGWRSLTATRDWTANLFPCKLSLGTGSEVCTEEATISTHGAMGKHMEMT